MAEFTVTWIINLDADNPLEAAVQAQEMMHDRVTDWQFDVKNEATGEHISIDLETDRPEQRG